MMRNDSFFDFFNPGFPIRQVSNFLEHLGPKSKKYRKGYETSANLIPNLRTSQNDNSSKILS